MSNRSKGMPTATSRLQQDYLILKRDPIPYITAEPTPTNILEWHYVVKGPEDSPYFGGYYHGTLIFPRQYPFKPPSIYMLTPNGRFKVNTRLCLSISDFHPDTWNPAWSVSTILTGLLSFMLETTPTLGSTESTQYEKQKLAKKSLLFNLKNSHFIDLFPDICNEINDSLFKQQQQLNIINSNQNEINNSNEIINSDTSRTQNIGTNFILNQIDNLNNNNNNNNNNRLNEINNNNNFNNNNFINFWYTIYSNLIVIISFAIFAIIVNLILKNIN